MASIIGAEAMLMVPRIVETMGVDPSNGYVIVQNAVNDYGPVPFGTYASVVDDGSGPFSGCPYYLFDGSGTDIIFTGDEFKAAMLRDRWTIEFWCSGVIGRRNPFDQYAQFPSIMGNAGVINFIWNGGNMTVYASENGTASWHSSSIGSVSSNLWNHVAICRDTSSTRIFCNGVHGITLAENYGAEQMRFHRLPVDGTTGSGTVNVPYRIAQIAVSSRCKWTENFTPPMELY